MNLKNDVSWKRYCEIGIWQINNKKYINILQTDIYKQLINNYMLEFQKFNLSRIKSVFLFIMAWDSHSNSS